MSKIKSLYVSMVLSVMTAPTAIFANYPSSSMAETNSSSHQRQMHNHDPYSQEEQQNQSYDSNPEIVDGSWETTSSRMNRQAPRSNPNWNRNEQAGDGSWETTSSRMNRQAPRSNPNWNRNEQTGDGSWETTSSRMNRQAPRSEPTWIRDEQNRNDPNAATRRNFQR